MLCYIIYVENFWLGVYAFSNLHIFEAGCFIATAFLSKDKHYQNVNTKGNLSKVVIKQDSGQAGKFRAWQSIMDNWISSIRMFR